MGACGGGNHARKGDVGHCQRDGANWRLWRGVCRYRAERDLPLRGPRQHVARTRCIAPVTLSAYLELSAASVDISYPLDYFRSAGTWSHLRCRRGWRFSAESGWRRDLGRPQARWTVRYSYAAHAPLSTQPAV